VQALASSSRRTDGWPSRISPYGARLPPGTPSRVRFASYPPLTCFESFRLYASASCASRTNWLQLPLTETADALGVPVGTARSRLHYAVAALRAALDADSRDEGPGR
jgi:hypothetical protein